MAVHCRPVPSGSFLASAEAPQRVAKLVIRDPQVGERIAAMAQATRQVDPEHPEAVPDRGLYEIVTGLERQLGQR